LKWCTVEMGVEQHEPDLCWDPVFRFEMMQPNRSFWSFYTESRIQQASFNTRNTFVESMYDLVIKINSVPPSTSIIVVWDTNLSPYDSTRGYHDERHLVAFSESPFLQFMYGLTHRYSVLGRYGQHDCLRSPRNVILHYDRGVCPRRCRCV